MALGSRSELAVCPRFQGAGIGAVLIQCAAEVAFQTGFRRIWLCVDGANRRARRLFKACGFRNLRVEERGDVEMVLNLTEELHSD